MCIVHQSSEIQNVLYITSKTILCENLENVMHDILITFYERLIDDEAKQSKQGTLSIVSFTEHQLIFKLPMDENI